MNNSYRPFGRFSLFPPVIKNLLIINAGIFFLQVITNNFRVGDVPAGYILNNWFALNPIAEGANFQVWQLITYQFMHGSFSHILFNMFGLWMFGMEIENLWGSKKFLIYYLLCGVAAGLFQLFLPPLFGQVAAITIGASGAVFGILIAFGMIFPERYIFLYFLVPVKAKYLIGFLIVLEFLLIDSAGSNVAHLAHLGGAIAGFIFIMLDKNTMVPLKNILNRSRTGSGSRYQNPFGGLSDRFRRRGDDVQEARFYDINSKKEEEITQEVIDKILDKISKSGYQNLTEKEKKILFDASKKN
ncbi:MAG TPA: rhomboid family intramembrane serine protease [Ignavibacteriaceae bacterium]|nr:rhomboid family intramembrane serine protease [Ignavibacteriaceae bacterium]